MLNIRIGNDISFIWSFYTEEGETRVPYDLTGKDTKIIMTDAAGRKSPVEFEVSGNDALWCFRGKDQCHLGEYTFTFYENYGEDGMKAVDRVHPICLVARQEAPESGIIGGGVSSMEVQTVRLDSLLQVAGDYEKLANLPKINDVTLIGNKSLAELGIASAEDLTAETERATEAETALQGNIDTEEARAKDAEEELGESIGAEAQRAAQAEVALSSAISAEVTRATAKEAELARDIAIEAERAENAEDTLQAGLNAEIQRATTKEAQIVLQLAEETERAGQAEDALAQDLTDETERATQAEQTNATAIATEVARATGVETTLQANISAEAQRAEGAEDTLQDNIDAETERAKGAESDLADAVESEETRATTKEGELEDAIEAEQTRAQGAETTLSTAISTETSRAQGAEGNLSTAISNETVRAANAESGLDTRITAIEGKIPSQASASNQLADKAFVNSSISTETATFRGTSASGLTEAQFLAWANGLTKDNNDYVFWNTADTAGNTQFKRYKYNGSSWVYEYTLNNSSFTAAQWAAINSGLTSGDKTALDAALAFIESFGNIVTHNTSEFATSAQGAKADTALQPSALTPYRTSEAQDVIDEVLAVAIDSKVAKSDIVDNLDSTDATKVLSAKQGSHLVDYIDQSISNAMAYVDQQDAAENAGRVAGDNLLTTRMDNLGLSVADGKLCITFNQ